MTTNFDLLGDPIPENFGKRGRPPHIPTEENRNKIMVLMALNKSDGEIAQSLSITKTTMRKYYFRELNARKEARARVDGARTMMLWNQMREGNVAAMKEFNRIMDKIDLDKVSDRFDADQAPKPAQIGKKEAAQRAAETAGEGTGWGSDLLDPTQTHH